MRVCDYQKRTLDESQRYFVNHYRTIQMGKWDRINDVIALIDSLAPKSSRIVEIGCGLGHISYFLAKNRGFRVTGYDLDADTVEQGNAIFRELDKGQTPADVRLKVGSYDLLPQEPEKADVVVGLEVIEHVDDPTEFLKSISAILKPGGLLFLSTPNSAGIKNFLPKNVKNIVRFVESLPFYTGGEEDHINFWDFQTLYRVCHRAGFKLVDYRFTNFYFAFPFIRKFMHVSWLRRLPIVGQYSNNLIFALQKT